MKPVYFGPIAIPGSPVGRPSFSRPHEPDDAPGGLMRRNCPYCNNRPCVCPGYPMKPLDNPVGSPSRNDPVADPCPSHGGKGGGDR